MKMEFEGIFVDSSYEGYNGWVEETTLETLDNEPFNDIIKPYLGKKVKITIEEVE